MIRKYVMGLAASLMTLGAFSATIAILEGGSGPSASKQVA
jgi:hypothetical protein